MKYAYMYIVIIILVVVIGCSKGPETIVSAPSSDTMPEGQPTQESVQPEQAAHSVSYDLSSEEESKALNFPQAKKTMISTPTKVMGVGDVYVFGLGIKNVMPKDTNFRVVLHFNRARTSGGLATLIETTEENTMLEWLGKNRFGIERIGSGQQKVLPLIVEIKPEIGPGEDIRPGSYEFSIRVEYETSPQFWDTYEDNILTLRVS